MKREQKEKKYNHEQMNNFSKNFVYLCNECMLSKHDLTGGLSSPKHCFATNTYLKLRKYHTLDENDSNKDWCPQDGTIRSFIEMFCKHFTPSVSINDMMNTDLSNRKFQKRESAIMTDFFEGVYFCYYLTVLNTLRFGLLKIKNYSENRYNCEAMLTISENLFSLCRKDIEQVVQGDKSLKELYDDLLNRTDINHIDKNFGYYTGEVSLFSESVLIVLNPQNNVYFRVLTFQRYDKYSNPKCIGVIANTMRSVYAAKDVTYQKMLLSRYNIYNEKNASLIMSSLALDKIENNIVLNNESKNQQMYKLIRQFENYN